MKRGVFMPAYCMALVWAVLGVFFPMNNFNNLIYIAAISVCVCLVVKILFYEKQKAKLYNWAVSVLIIILATILSYNLGINHLVS